MISPEGAQLGVMDARDAIRKAEELGLDLVEVAPTAKPPVCRIMDFGKYKYEMSKKAHESKKRQTVITVKEVKLRPRTDEHDIQFKMNHIRRFLVDGNKVKLTIMFRGREMAHTEQGRAVMERVIKGLEDIASVEQPVGMEGRNMVAILGQKAK